MSRKVVTFEDFSGGEFGLLTEARAPKGSFTGTNVVRLFDGSLAPRSGLVSLAPTGLTAGTMYGFGFNAGQQKLWWVAGTTVYQLATTALAQATATVGTIASTPTKRIRSLAQQGTKTYLTNWADKSYTVDHAAPSVTALTGSPGGRLVALYGDRLVVAGSSANPHRLQWSAPKSFTRWPSAAYADIGETGYALNVLAAHRAHLTIGRDDGSWWEFRGTPGSDQNWHRTLTGVRAGAADNGASRFAVTADDNVAFMPDYSEYPVLMARGAMQRLEHLSLTNLGGTHTDSGVLPKVGGTGLTSGEDLLFVTGGAGSAFDNQGLLFHRGGWTKHAFGQSVSGHVDGRTDPQRRVFFTNGASTPAFYAWSYDLNRPPISGNTWESLGDGVSTALGTCEFTLPEFWEKDGSEAQVVAVIVDFKKWNQGWSAVNNAFTVALTPLRRDGSGTGTERSKTWTEAASAASSSGTIDRVRLSFGSSYQYANGVRVKVTGMVGVAIRKIHVVYDTRPAQSH